MDKLCLDYRILKSELNYKPKADSTLNVEKKKDLIETIRFLETKLTQSISTVKGLKAKQFLETEPLLPTDTEMKMAEMIKELDDSLYCEDCEYYKQCPIDCSGFNDMSLEEIVEYFKNGVF